MDTSQSSARPLEMVFLPFLTPSHIIPLFEMGRLFAARGQHVTVVTTPAHASDLRPTVDADTAAGHHISLHTVPFPSREVGLPDGLENFMGADVNTTIKLFQGFNLLRPDIEEYIVTHRPDCIVSDFFFHWSGELANRLGIPRLHFHASSMFFLCLDDAARSPDCPHSELQSDYESFVIPNLPDPISFTRSRLPDYIRDSKLGSDLLDQWKDGQSKSYGLLVNNFYEMEPAYTEHYVKKTGEKIFHLGPMALIHRNNHEKAERVYKTAVGEHECLSWLNSKQPNSVLYVCFGSVCKFPDDQLMEIARGLEDSGHDFIWVLQGKDQNDEEEEEKWLPKGFRKRIIGRGMLVKGWAPQVLILDHSSIGGFMTHCGWNSLTEGVSAGVPMITWPLHSDQHYNEKLVTQVLEIGVEVGAEDWCHPFSVGKKVIKKENIEQAVRRLMNGDDEVVGVMRKKAKELGEKAKKAVEEGGSSHKNLTILIEELKSLLKDKRSQDP